MPILMQGNEAVAAGALAAGVRFFAGYPITPSTEIAEQMAAKLPRLGGKFIQMEDEIASMAAVIGASLAGVKSLTATSGPGFSLKQENIGFAAMAEVPCVIVNVQRAGPSTGIATAPAQGDVMQARWGTHGDHPAIALTPASVKECFSLAARAVAMAETYCTPVILLLDEVIGHLRERVEEGDLVLPEPPSQVSRPTFGAGQRYHVTGLYHTREGFPTEDPQLVEAALRQMHAKIEDSADIGLAEQLHTDDADVLVVAYGAVARSAQRAVRLAREQGLRAGLLRLITIWPFPEQLIGQLAAGCHGIVVPEMNLGQVRLEIERAVHGAVPVLGVNRVSGEIIKPGEVLEAIKRISAPAGVNKKGRSLREVRGVA